MNIVLVGTGKTGSAIESLAQQYGHTVVARFNSANPVLNQTDDRVLCSGDVIIDFSRPDLALPHIQKYCDLNLHAVIGTTGWYEHLGEVKSRVEQSEAGILYAPNFSVGVAVLSRLVQQAGKLINRISEYDASVHEVHHKFKLDSPSGTGIHLANLLLDQLDRKQELATETQHQQISDTSLHLSSQRVGEVFGHHTVTFDGPFDQILLTHDAKNRNGFANGAIRAAEWLIGKKGLFTLDDLLAAWLQ